MTSKTSNLKSYSTRRNIITGIAGIIASYTAPAYITKSLIGGRENILLPDEGDTPTPADYVQDGLIAMWDGEWNAGVGVHDPRSRQIVNLCGGSPIVLSPEVTVGNRSVSYITSAAGDYGGITDEMAELPLPGVGVTNESVWWTNRIASWSVSNNAFLYRNGTAIVNGNNTGVGMGFYRNNETNFRCGTHYYNIGVLAGLVSSTNQVRAWNDHTGYINMTALVSTNSLSVGTAFVDDARVRIMSSNTAGAQFKFACLRIYNRSLTDSEIAANYAVDKARFNLP